MPDRSIAASRPFRKAGEAMKIDSVVTHHTDAFRSGVARFNEILAERLGVPLLGLDDAAAGSTDHPLLSFKMTEMAEPQRAALDRILERTSGRAELLLHDWGGSEAERAVVGRVARVWAANHAIDEALREFVEPAGCLWAPGLLEDRRTFTDVDLSVFSFGMAHKIRTERFSRLRGLLQGSGRSYAVYVSSANHETTTMQEAQSVYEDMHDLFPDDLYFMGNLSDVAVHNYLRTTTFFASFFPDGVRANNTSVNAAMEQGCVVITNLDRHSPEHLVHMENVIDIDRCDELPTDPAQLERIGSAAREAATAYSWASLLRVFD
jgi:hypothetical protein